MAGAMTLPSKSRPCPICGSDVCRDVGPIFHARPALVAGVEIDLGDADFHLLHCPTCDFRFKDPPIPAEKLMACYAAAAELNWGLNPDPWERYFDKMGHTLRRFIRATCPGYRML